MTLPSPGSHYPNLLLSVKPLILNLHPQIVHYPFLHFSFIIFIMVCGIISHVGLAIFNPSGFPTQWVLAISENELFEGRVFCSTVGTTVNGWQEIWVECESSPATFNLSATFAGVIHIAVLTVPMKVVLSEIKSKGLISTKNANPAYTDQYVLQALRRIGDRRFGPSNPLSREKELNEAIQARIPLLNHPSLTASTFPIVSISLDGVRIGRRY